ncbi:MAG: hypothetical protein JWN86_2137 [Planctomycetota bacterium]|nr:hypothetical protein [Planctomycetota bacterium]
MTYFDRTLIGKNSVSFQIRNGTDRPRAIWIELWSHDYTLLPLESMEIVVWGRAETPQVEITENALSTVIVLSPPPGEMSFGEYIVHQYGVVLEPAYQRQAGLDAGLEY